MCRCFGGAGSVTSATVHHEASEPARLSSGPEASGFLVGPAVFKTDERATSSLAGSIPVRLRHEERRSREGSNGLPSLRSACP